MNQYKRSLMAEIRAICREKGLSVAQSNGYVGLYFKSIRIYKHESDKGHVDRAIYHSDKLNKKVVSDIRSL